MSRHPLQLGRLFAVLFGLASPAWAAGDGAPDWYYPEWLATAPQAPVFQVRDTVNKYGRYANQTKAITLKDLIKYHGHFCGGLVEGAVALKVAFDRLFPDGVVDRTDLRIASNNSACGGDVAAYLTGARTRFGSHFIDPGLNEGDFVVQRVSSRKTVRVVINAATYPRDVREQMRKIESGNFAPGDLDRFQDLQWAYARKLVSRPPGDSVEVTEDAAYDWPALPCADMGARRDNDLKNSPEAR